jgi:hypothetical protein
MRILCAAAVIALLTGPAYAQGVMPNINLFGGAIQNSGQKETEAAGTRLTAESLKNTGRQGLFPPWGTVRSTEQAAAPATGSTAN